MQSEKIETKIHTHEVEGGWLTHRHELGGTHHLKLLEFNTHTHLIVLAERNFINEFSGPPLP